MDSEYELHPGSSPILSSKHKVVFTLPFNQEDDNALEALDNINFDTIFEDVKKHAKPILLFSDRRQYMVQNPIVNMDFQIILDDTTLNDKLMVIHTITIK
jgi:hypothetical protein